MTTDTKLQEITLLDRREIAAGTMELRFAKPAGFTFKAGQAIDVEVGGERHAFSIVTAPHEDHIAIATRMRDSAYKRALGALQPGERAGLDGPFGSLTLHNKCARAAVFIAGGIGITPFMSMIRNATHEHLPQKITLLYSNRRPEDAAFLEELQTLQAAFPDLRLVATMTEMEKSARSWQGERRLIDADFVRDAVRDLPDPIYYVAGPPAMVEAVRKTLGEAGIDDDDIRSEDFYGY